MATTVRVALVVNLHCCMNPFMSVLATPCEAIATQLVLLNHILLQWGDVTHDLMPPPPALPGIGAD